MSWVVECEQGLLLHYSPFMKELLSAVTCLCTAPVLILPDITVEVVCLALNLLVGSGGKEVTLEYERLEPAAIVFSTLGINFSYGFNELQAEKEQCDEVNHNGFILYSTAYYVMSFSDLTDDSYFIFYW